MDKHRVLGVGVYLHPLQCLKWHPTRFHIWAFIISDLHKNDIVQDLTSTCRLYTDDRLLYRRIDTLADARALQDDLQLLELWEEKWRMSLNVDKCITVKKEGYNMVFPVAY